MLTPGAYEGRLEDALWENWVPFLEEAWKKGERDVHCALQGAQC